MVFADLFFVYAFLPLCFLSYFLARKLTTKNTVLIIFSLIFYAWGEPVWILLLLFSSFLNWFMGLQIQRFRGKSTAKVAMTLAVVIDVLLLLVFKYSGLLVETFNSIFRCSIPVPQIRMPIGISFFTFQAISYVLDCYWGNVTAQKQYKKFLLYLSLFPQLIAGPIVRYSVVEQEIDNRQITREDLCEGALRAILGLAKKVILANNLYTIVDTFFGNGGVASLSMMGTWYTAIVYTLYIYFDFSGYSDIAIGLGRMFGFHFDENFRHPFACKTITEFWRRWHISLSSWFRDYIYIPMGGNRVSKGRWMLNILTVWALTGFWHGAQWNFLLWGLFYGVILLMEKLFLGNALEKCPAFFRHLYSKLIIVIGFGIFYFEDMGRLGQFFRNIFGISLAHGGTFTDPITWNSLQNNLFLVLFAAVVSFPVLPKIKTFFLENKSDTVYAIGRICSVILCLGLLILSSILLVDNTNNFFLYWRF